MADIAPSATYHHTELGIKAEDLAKEKLARPLVSIRQTGFEDGNEIETETDEGHTGVANLDMGSYRTSAESSPTWEDGVRYAQGFEDYIYLLLANDTITTYKDSENNEVAGIFNHHFEMPPDTEKELPLATIYHGFQKTQSDARIFNNAMLNELEFTMASDDKPTISPTFISDYNIVNCKNPTRNLLADHLARTVMAQHTKVYIGAVGATADEMLANPINCFTEASWTVNHNAESQSCHEDAFGENTKIMGSREVEGSISMPWVDRTKYFETEYECYDKYGHIVSTEITQKQVWYLCEGGSIPRVSDSNTLGDGETLIREETVDGSKKYIISTGVPYRALFIFPVVEVTNVTSTKSGDEAKDVTFEWKVIEQPDKSYMSADIRSDLAEIHIDSTGQTKESCYAPLPVTSTP